MLLDGLSDIIVSYHVQSAGVEVGELLLVEYWTSFDTWGLLQVVNSPGIDLDFFIEYEHTLGSLAYHDEFRLRFRVEGNQVNDKWFVDDIYVGPVQVNCPGDADGNLTVDFQDLLAVLASWARRADAASTAMNTIDRARIAVESRPASSLEVPRSGTSGSSASVVASGSRACWVGLVMARRW